MATAEELRQRIAALNQDTASRLGPNPATQSMQARMAASNRVLARDAAVNPASDSMRTRIAQLDRSTARTLRGAPTAPAGTQFTSPNAASFSGTSAASAPRGAGVLGRIGNALRAPVGRPIASTVGRGAVGLGRAALGLPGLALSAGLLAYQNRSGDAIAERTGLDDLQNRMLSDDPEVSRAAVAEFRGAQQAGAPESAVEASPAPLSVDGSAPVNTIRTADGRVLPVNPDVQVNTMSPENFTRIGSGLGQRLGDARLAAAERGDFGQLETDRAAFEGQLDTNRQIVADYERQQAEALLARSGGVTGRRLAPVSQREGSAARTAMATLAQLNADADRNAGVESERIAAESRRAPPENPLMNPQVIAERLRQEGADRRQDTGQDLFRGLEPIEDIQGGVTGFQGLDSQGVPVVIPQAELPVLQSQFQQFRTNGTIPPNMSFADFVSRINAATAQG